MRAIPVSRRVNGAEDKWMLAMVKGAASVAEQAKTEAAAK